MNKSVFVSGTLALGVLLTACGDQSSNNQFAGNNASNLTSSGTEASASPADTAQAEGTSYKKIETIELNGHISRNALDLDRSGDILLWGEQDSKLDNMKRLNYWNGGKHELLDLDAESIGFAFLTQSGLVVFSESDWDKPVTERHAIIEFDPVSKESTAFVMNDERDNILTPLGTNYTEDPRTYIGINEYQRETVQPFIWNLDTNTIQDIELTEAIREQTAERLTIYPHYALTSDQSQLVAVVANVGILVTDLASNQSEWVYTSDNISANNELAHDRVITADDRYVLYTVYDDDQSTTQFAFDLERKQAIEIGKGKTTFTLEDGPVVLITDQDEFVHVDLGTEEKTTLLTPALQEQESVVYFTVSRDGSTLVYVTRDKEQLSKLHIFKKEA